MVLYARGGFCMPGVVFVCQAWFLYAGGGFCMWGVVFVCGGGFCMLGVVVYAGRGLYDGRGLYARVVLYAGRGFVCWVWFCMMGVFCMLGVVLYAGRGFRTPVFSRCLIVLLFLVCMCERYPSTEFASADACAGQSVKLCGIYILLVTSVLFQDVVLLSLY